MSGMLESSAETATEARQPAENQVAGAVSLGLGHSTPTRIEATYQDPAQAAHDRQVAAFESRVQIITNSILLVLASTVIVGIIATCLYILLNTSYPATTVDKVAGILVAITSGGFGYFAGQRTKK